MEQEQEAELVFRRVRVIDETGMVTWVDRPLPVGTVKIVVASGDSVQDAGVLPGERTAA